MREAKIFPVRAGELGWFHDAKNKTHTFAKIEDIENTYDYVIIGAGYAGINCAQRLADLNPDASIAVFEALEVGMGDSGRNAGFLIDVPHSFGEAGITVADHKMRLHLNTLVINRMRQTLKTSGVSCDWDETGKYLAAREKEYIKNLEGFAGVLNQLDAPFEMIEGSDLPARLGTDYYMQALYSPSTVLLNPADVIRALAMSLPENVQVFEQCPVRQLCDGSPSQVALLNGKTVVAGKVFILASIFGEELGASKNKMTPVNSFGAFTRVLTNDEMKAFEGIKAWGCTSGHAAGTTVRLTTTNRIFVRNGFTYSASLCTSPQRLQWARRSLRKAFEVRFPNLKYVNFEYVYGGMIPMTFNNESLFTKLNNCTYAGSSGDGAGLTRSSMLGVYLAEWACNIDSEELRYLQKTSKPNWCPPNIFKTVGATVRLAWEEFRAKGEK